MDTAINGFGALLIPTTNSTQTQVAGAQLPANGPDPHPASVPAAISDPDIKDTFTFSQQASVFIAPASETDPAPAAPAVVTPLEQFEQDQPPPPYTLERVTRDASRADTRLTPRPYNLFQLRQFTKLLTTLRGLTSAVLPSVSFSV